jgi:hypothetical protein
MTKCDRCRQSFATIGEYVRHKCTPGARGCSCSRTGVTGCPVHKPLVAAARKAARR